jgi:hypothetical protein
MQFLRFRFVTTGVVALFLGCGSPSDRVEVNGTVRWQGEPLPSGHIAFFLPQQIPAGAGKITDGTFNVQCKPGMVRVEILAIRETGKIERSEGEPAKEQYIPAHYNQRSTLTAEIAPPGPVTLLFDLKDKE